MNQADMGLWRVVDALARQIPFSKQKVETLLSTRLSDKNSTPYTTFLEGSGPELKEGVTISHIDLRLKPSGTGPGFLVLDIGGACVTVDQVKAHHENLRVTGLPREGSPDEETYYSKILPWGKLSFGFKEENPRCLSSVVFSPTGS